MSADGEGAKALPWEYDTCCAIVRCDESRPGARRHVDGGYYAILFEGEPEAVKLAIDRVNGTPDPATARVLEAAKAWHRKRNARFGPYLAECEKLSKAVEALAAREIQK